MDGHICTVITSEMDISICFVDNCPLAGCHATGSRCAHLSSLRGLAVKHLTWELEWLGSNPTSHLSGYIYGLNVYTMMATWPDANCLSAGTGWPGAHLLSLSKISWLICSFRLSVAAHTICVSRAVHEIYFTCWLVAMLPERAAARTLMCNNYHRTCRLMYLQSWTVHLIFCLYGSEHVVQHYWWGWPGPTVLHHPPRLLHRSAAAHRPHHRHCQHSQGISVNTYCFSSWGVVFVCWYLL